MATPRAPAMLLVAAAVVAETAAPVKAQSVQGIVAPVTVPTTTQTMTDAVSRNAVQVLEAYVDALVEVDQVVRRWQPHVDKVGGTQQEAAVRAQADVAIHTAIERDGRITVAEYQRIGATALRDPALLAQIQRMYRERTGN